MPRQGLGHSSVDIYNFVTPGTDDAFWKHPSSGSMMIGYQQTRTNTILYSQDVTNAESYTKTNTAIDTTLYEAPDNSTTANAIKSNSTGEKNYKIVQGSLSVTSGSTYTLSVHAKEGNLGFAKVQFNDGATDFTADFNLNTGAITNTANLIDQAVDAMDDDWYRCSITFQAGNTSSSSTATVFAQVAAGDATPNIASETPVILLYVWGFQLEQDIAPTAYIATTNEVLSKTTTLNDTSEIWDLDGVNLMPETDPDDDGAWEVMPELVTNGGFDADANWTKGTGWTISSGKAHVDCTSTAGLTQSLSGLGNGNTYDVTITVSNYSAGTLQPQFGGVLATPTAVNSNGTHNFKIIATGSTMTLYLYALTTSEFSIDNVTITEYAIKPLDV